MRKIGVYTFLLLYLLTSCTSNYIDEAEQAIKYKDIEKHIAVLSGDDFMGRKPFTEGEDLTLAYLKREFQRIGLEPPVDGSYFQEVPLVEVNGKFGDLHIKSADNELVLKPYDDFVVFSRRIEEEINLENTEMVFAGYGIVAPEYNWNDYQGIDVKGKIAVVIVNDPGYGSDNKTLFNGNAMTYYGRWTYKYEEAARQGAAGCLIIHETGPAGYPWSVVRNGVVGGKLYLQPEDGYKNRCSIEGWLTNASAQKLFEQAGLNFEAELIKAKRSEFQSFELPINASVSLKQHFKYDISKNVLGLIRGTDLADEVVIYTAHWDHLGIVDPIDGDSIVNGATDNASAVSWMLEIAEAFKQLKEKPRRSILFISVTAEESGLLGSSYYVENPLFPMGKTAAVFNTDVILFLGKFKDVTITGYGQSELDDYVARAAELQGRYAMGDLNPENGMYYRSDHFPFAKAGVPAMFGKGYSHHAKKGKDWTLEQIDNYWKNTYHKPSDEYHPERDNLDGLVDDAKLFFRVGVEISMDDYFPQWKDGSEFKSVRDQYIKQIVE